MQTKHNIVVKWSTLSQYFEGAMAHGTDNYPVMRGSFFPYSDRQLDYWTGYFNSRIFYKGVDRQLEGCVKLRAIRRRGLFLSFFLSFVAHSTRRFVARARVHACASL